ncbi:MAG: hypothetical protein GXO34_07140 [Deltaproteobacteria bacterium]|nr:hypothetical protein [Deltaproteobacteria bacterium]
MNEKIFKTLAVVFFALVAISFFWPSAGEKNYNVNVQTVSYAADGLDLSAIGSLLKKAKDAAELERLLNDPATGINNLDLNEDGKVDFIKVTEFGEGETRGFSLTVEPEKGEVQEVATITIEKAGDKANVEVRGNEQIYGPQHIYHNSFGLTDMLLLYWLFRPHPFYMSPWGYGHYPSYYHTYAPVSPRQYQRRVASHRNLKRTSKSTIKNRVKSPYAGRAAARGVKAPLKHPTASQKSFQKRNPSKQLRRGGFGRSSRPSRPSVRRSSGFGRSGSRFGGK